MQVLDSIKEYVDEHWPCHSAVVLAIAAASACSSYYGVSLLKISYRLDKRNKLLVLQLMQITHLPDFNNAAQDRMLRFLEQKGCLEYIKNNQD
jgi:hypothetical protein